MELKLCYLSSVTYTDNLFYQYGPGNYRGLQEYDIVIFYSEEMAGRLRKFSTIAVNGTFTVVGKPYYQLSTVDCI